MFECKFRDDKNNAFCAVPKKISLKKFLIMSSELAITEKLHFYF